VRLRLGKVEDKVVEGYKDSLSDNEDADEDEDDDASGM